MTTTHTAVRPLITNTLLFGLLCEPDAAGHAAAALLGDKVARDFAVPDYLEEKERNVIPFAVGEKHLILTETMYYVGLISEVCGGFLVLDAASWVHWTGRLSALCAAKSFTAKRWPAGARRPRTEYIGRVIVSLSKIVASAPSDWELPAESITT